MATMKHGTAAGTSAPTIFVLFGATGDLAKRLVIPAFYRLALEGLLPRQWLLIGNGRGDVAHEDFRKHVHDVLTEFGPKPEQPAWDAFAKRVLFAGGGFTTDSPGSLLDVIAKARRELGGSPQLVHYLAVPPVAFTELTKALGQHNLAKGARVVYEKPFGTSPTAFRELDRAVHSVLDEEQVYRIDHFLGKEATQDLHVLRFANGLFAGMWDRQHVESVQIDVPERLGITDRSVFYDATGAVLDMLVTHLFQVAAEVAMEPPASLKAADLQAAREKVIRSFRPLDRGRGRARAVLRLSGTCPAWRRGRSRTPSSPPGYGSTTRAGAACRSTSAPASGWRPRSSASASSSASPTARWLRSCLTTPTYCRSRWPATARSTSRWSRRSRAPSSTSIRRRRPSRCRDSRALTRCRRMSASFTTC